MKIPKKIAPKTYKKMQKTHRNCKNHTKNAKNDISGITDILPGFSPHWLSTITSFHHIGDDRYYRDILESVPTLTSVPSDDRASAPAVPPAPRRAVPSFGMTYSMRVFYYCRTYYKAVRVGGEESGGHVQRETTSRGLSGLVCPSRTSERGG
jgi:hypothetical protein